MRCIVCHIFLFRLGLTPTLSRPQPLCTKSSWKNQTLQECITFTRNHHISELKKCWLSASQLAFETQQRSASTNFQLRKKGDFWYVVAHSCRLQCDVINLHPNLKYTWLKVRKISHIQDVWNLHKRSTNGSFLLT